MGKVWRGTPREENSAAGRGEARRQWRGGVGWEARRRGQGGTEAAAVPWRLKQRGRGGTRPRAYIRLYRALDGGASLLRLDAWRVTAAP